MGRRASSPWRAAPRRPSVSVRPPSAYSSSRISPIHVGRLALRRRGRAVVHDPLCSANMMAPASWLCWTAAMARERLGWRAISSAARASSSRRDSAERRSRPRKPGVCVGGIAALKLLAHLVHVAIQVDIAVRHARQPFPRVCAARFSPAAPRARGAQLSLTSRAFRSSSAWAPSRWRSRRTDPAQRDVMHVRSWFRRATSVPSKSRSSY